MSVIARAVHRPSLFCKTSWIESKKSELTRADGSIILLTRADNRTQSVQWCDAKLFVNIHVISSRLLGSTSSQITNDRNWRWD